MQKTRVADDETGRLLELLDRELTPMRTERYRMALVWDLARELHRFGCKAVITPTGREFDPTLGGGPDFRIDFEPLE
jgi:hypothetical protein